MLCDLIAYCKKIFFLSAKYSTGVQSRNWINSVILTLEHVTLRGQTFLPTLWKSSEIGSHLTQCSFGHKNQALR